MAWNVSYPSNFTNDGDLTNEVLLNHINEFKTVYAILNELFSGSTGHNHDGTGNNSRPISSVGLSTNAVVTSKIADDAVTSSKIADGCIDSIHIATNNTITVNKALNIPTSDVGGNIWIA